MVKGFETAFARRAADSDLLTSLRDTHAAFFAGRTPRSAPREIIRESWLRVRRYGLSPATGGLPDEHTAHPRFQAAAEPIQPDVVSGLLPLLCSQLDPLLDDDETLLVITDAAGTVVARAGGPTITVRADQLGFAPGYSWAERYVGTNAIGTAVATGGPVHVHAAEHFCFSHHEWSCAAAPVRDPRNGRMLGIVNLSFRAEQAHPTAIALAVALARQSELALRDAHRRSLRRLQGQSTAPPESGPWVLVDSWGWIADASAPLPTERLTLPTHVDEAVAVEGLGMLHARAVDGGWLLTDTEDAAAGDGIQIRLGDSRCEVIVSSGGHEWTHVLIGRRAAIVRALVEHPQGMTSRRLSEAVYGTGESEVAVRAEVRRIRREVGGLILAKPYRLADTVTIAR
ncbi:GAF domain-containing protein [Microbacterium lacticum]|uniref:GAF domain-containing protein n=1 Tax=Microbacterium lacticum TaxID=33885 RepID=UPI003A86BC05